MSLTRDSFVLWLAIIGSLIGYLAAAGAPPTEWTYQDWIQFAMAVIATISGKLATSPLKGKND